VGPTRLAGWGEYLGNVSCSLTPAVCSDPTGVRAVAALADRFEG